MENSPFLPGLVLTLTVWILPLVVRFLPTRAVLPLTNRFPWISDLAPWIYSLGPTYVGLLLGWISSRDYGLTGQTGLEWVLGVAAAILLGLILAWASVRFSNPRGWGDVRDEACWSLYRAAAWPLVNFLSYAVIAGLLASLIEFALGKWKGAAGFSRTTVIPFLVRTLGSGALFLLAHNFFLAMFYYLIAYLASLPRVYKRIERIYITIANVISKKQ
ncbi:MAG TPA: hypothetical protein VII90_02530 [Anaerolineales bacterium]